MKFTVIGASNTEGLAAINPKLNYTAWLNKLAKVCLNQFDELFFIPDHGVYVDFAMAYQKLGGKITAVMPYENEEMIAKAKAMGAGYQVIPDGTGWTFLNSHFVGSAPYCLCLSFSAGSLLELCSSKYMQIYSDKPCTFFIDSRTTSAKLPREVEQDVYKVCYFNSETELQHLLKEHCHETA